MDDLIAFVRARLDEDERIARAAAGDVGAAGAGVWTFEPHHDSDARVDGDITIYDEGGHGPEHAEHIARHDPARVLDDVVVARSLLAFCERTGEGELLLTLASVWKDHPHWHPSWPTS